MIQWIDAVGDKSPHLEGDLACFFRSLGTVLAQRDHSLATVHEVLQSENLPNLAPHGRWPSPNMEATDFRIEEIDRAVMGAQGVHGRLGQTFGVSGFARHEHLRSNVRLGTLRIQSEGTVEHPLAPPSTLVPP